MVVVVDGEETRLYDEVLSQSILFDGPSARCRVLLMDGNTVIRVEEG